MYSVCVCEGTCAERCLTGLDNAVVSNIATVEARKIIYLFLYV